MIILVSGLLGTGKTLFLSYLGYIEKKLDIYGNYNLKVKNFTRINPYQLEGIEKGLILLQEAFSWFDSRTSNSQENRYLTNRVGFSSRKRGLTIALDAQLESSIDLRFRNLADFYIKALGYNPKYRGFYYKINNRLNTYSFVLPYSLAEKIFKIYDTYEFETDSLPTIYEPNRLNNFIENLIDVLKKHYGKKVFTLSRGMINDFLIDNYKQGLPSRKIIDLIYSRLRREKLENENS